MRTSARALTAAMAVLTFSFATVGAQAQGCGGCGSGAGHGGHAHAAQAAAGPTTPILVNYDTIQVSLADDSLRGVAEAAGAIAKLAAADPTKTVPADLAAQAGSLARAKDLAEARESFKQLSASLIGFLERQKVGTGHLVVYCDMAKASWLQREPSVRNPYFGKAMLKCGEVRRAI
ncbi:MAG: DUF3347 domain-containing protein [Verrucomicrobia bacterium]|nr:DUF3347 domain-containing protein [Verrucomicrobiota bacterium]